MTRSIGDIPFQHYLSSLADVVVVPRVCSSAPPAFVVIGTDGLWDVLSNDDATRLVQQLRTTWIDAADGSRSPPNTTSVGSAQHTSQRETTPPDIDRASVCDHGEDAALPTRTQRSSGWEAAAARRLAWEAYVRGSSDNVGVYVVDLSTPTAGPVLDLQSRLRLQHGRTPKRAHTIAKARADGPPY